MAKKPTYKELENRVRVLEKAESERKKAEAALRKNEDEMRGILDVTDETIGLIDCNGVVLTANQTSCKRLNVKKEDLLGRYIYDFFPPDVAEKRRREYETVFVTGKPVSFEDTREGMTFEQNVYPIFTNENRVEKAVIFARNITKRSRFETALRESETRLRALIQTIPDLVWLKDPRGIYLACNPRFEKFFGAKERDIIGKTDYDFVDKELADFFRKHDNEAIAKGTPCRNEEILTFANDGHREHIETIKTPLYGNDGKLAGVLGIGRDITERKRVETALRESEERYRILFNNANDSVFVHQPQTDGKPRKFLEINDVACRMYGYSRAEFLNLRPIDLAIPEREKEARTQVKGLLSKGYDIFENIHRTKTGREFPVEVSAYLFDFRGIPTILSIVRDITQRKQAEAARLENEKKYQDLFERAQVGLFQTRLRDGLFLEANQRLAEMFGYDSPKELIGQLATSDLYADPEARTHMVTELKEKGEIKNYETRFKKRDGSIWWARFSGMLYDKEGYFEGVLTDITENIQAAAEKKRLEEQYRQAQKMEAIGRLAGGVAHDLNNLLTPILGYSEMLMADFSPDDRRRRSVEQIVRAGYRTRDLVRQLLAFGRKQTLEYKPLNINNIIEDFRKLLRRTILENIALDIIPSPEARTVTADIGQIEQVIMNLAVNAQDAMPDGGRLILETAVVEIDERYAAVHPDTQPGAFVMLAVSDTGCGMDEKTQAHIFEPFFSTKGEQGNGLGLATVYGIVKQHGGNIWVYSEPGQGSTIKIYLPVSEGAHVEKRHRGKSTDTLRGTETILLVEDNQQVRDLGHTVLTQLGYRVIAAENGAEALKHLASHDSPVHLLLTDVIMPGINGKELFTQIAGKYPGLKVLYMSGYTDSVIAHHGVLEKGVKFLQKPFTVNGLAIRVREVLQNSGQRHG